MKTSLQIRNIILAVAVLTVFLFHQLRSQDAASKTYEKAYGYILEEKWNDAQKALNNFMQDYPKSKLTDAAKYWHCYTRDKLGEDQEAVFQCYNDFIKSYPKSKWASDAKSNLVRIAYDTRVSLIVGLFASALAVIVGTVVGIVAVEDLDPLDPRLEDLGPQRQRIPREHDHVAVLADLEIGRAHV